jgi:hypothetical protein
VISGLPKPEDPKKKKKEKKKEEKKEEKVAEPSPETKPRSASTASTKNPYDHLHYI